MKTSDDGLRLVEFAPEHSRATFEWIQDTELRRDFLMRGPPPDWQTHQNYIEQITTDKTQKVYAILYNSQHIGNCGIKNIEPEVRGELWIYFGVKDVRRQGLGIRSVGLIEECARQLRLRELFLHVVATNTAAYRLYTRTGFVEVVLDDPTVWADRGVTVIKMRKSVRQ